MFEEIKALFDYGFTQNKVELQKSFYDIRFRWSKRAYKLIFRKGIYSWL